MKDQFFCSNMILTLILSLSLKLSRSWHYLSLKLSRSWNFWVLKFFWFHFFWDFISLRFHFFFWDFIFFFFWDFIFFRSKKKIKETDKNLNKRIYCSLSRHWLIHQQLLSYSIATKVNKEKFTRNLILKQKVLIFGNICLTP